MGFNSGFKGLMFCTTSAGTVLMLRRVEGETVINVHRSACKVLVILATF